jgi:hypothetical protein
MSEQRRPIGYRAWCPECRKVRWFDGFDPKPPGDAECCGRPMPFDALHFDVPTPTPATPPSAPLADRLEGVRRFLDGSSPTKDGVWFGERHPDKPGLFWWRSALLPTLHDAAAALRAAEQDRAEVLRLMDAMELAWGVIANVDRGNWHMQSEEWRNAATYWRDEHWHPALERTRAARKEAGNE